MKIATKTGDDGSTGLFGGLRVSKSSLVIEVLGCLDELQAFLGWCKVCAEDESEEVANNLDKIQEDLYRIMGGISGGGEAGVSEKDVSWLEELIEKYEMGSDGLDGFIKPGKNELSARFHIARTVCRRSERAFVKFMKDEEKFANVDEAVVEMKSSMDLGSSKKASYDFCKIVLKYLNRLSDLMFLMG